MSSTSIRQVVLATHPNAQTIRVAHEKCLKRAPNAQAYRHRQAPRTMACIGISLIATIHGHSRAHHRVRHRVRSPARRKIAARQNRQREAKAA